MAQVFLDLLRSLQSEDSLKTIETFEKEAYLKGYIDAIGDCSKVVLADSHTSYVNTFFEMAIKKKAA